MKKVLVITGIGGVGLAIARRIGTGYKLVLADFAKDTLAAAATSLTGAGYDVEPVELDVTNRESVEGLAQTAAGFGPLHAVVHTAGLSPTMANPGRILQVNLLGTARIIEAFEPHLTTGTVGVMIASMAGHMAAGSLDPTWQQQLAKLKADELPGFIDSLNIQEPGAAYSIAKYGNLVQVQAAALPWGAKGARIVSVSPGIIATPMGQQEQAQQPHMAHLLAHSPVPRIGTPEDIAAAVEFLQSPQASFITGTDLLVDGGAVSLVKATSAT